MSNKLGAFDSSFGNIWPQNNDFTMFGLEDSANFTEPNGVHANRVEVIGQIFENSYSYHEMDFQINPLSKNFQSPPLEGNENNVDYRNSSELNSTTIEQYFPEGLNRENLQENAYFQAQWGPSDLEASLSRDGNFFSELRAF